jgi:hypothetical protein
MRKKVYFAVLLFLIVSTNSHSQVTGEWVIRYNNAHNLYDNANIVRADDMGNIYVCGETSVPGVERITIVLKYDTLGNLIWNKNNGGATYEDYGTFMEFDKNENIYVGVEANSED